MLTGTTSTATTSAFANGYGREGEQTRGPYLTAVHLSSLRQPLFWACLAFASGICLGHRAWRPSLWWLLASLGFAAAAGYFLKRRPLISVALVLGAFVFAGALTIQTWSDGNSEVAPWFGDGEPVTVTAHVTAEGNVESEPGTLRERIDVETERIQTASEARDTRFGLRLTVYSKALSEETDARPADLPPNATNAMRPFRYGQRLRFESVLNPPRNYRNPGAFDYAGYLRGQGIVATASTKYASIEVLPGTVGTHWGMWLSRARRSILEKIPTLWPEQLAGLMDAMVIGEKSFIERPVRVNFQRSGTYHMLVVAGLHVGILAGFVLWSLRGLRLGEEAASFAAMLSIFVYAALTREGAPVWRAAVMFAVYLATRLLYRKRALLNTLGAAGLILLLFNPEGLFGASLQMTLLCVALIAGVSVPLLERTIEPYAHGLRNLHALAYDRALPRQVAQFRVDLRMVLARISRLWNGRGPERLLLFTLRSVFAAINLIAISATMQLGMALPMAVYFHRATSVALPANLLVVPLLQVLMPIAVLAIASSYISVWLASFPAALARYAIEGIAGTVGWLGGLRLADIRVAEPNPPVIAATGAAILLAIILARRRAAYATASILFLAITSVWIWRVPPRPQIRPGVLEMTAIDVGQGDSILLVMPDGHKLLIDGGGLPFWTHSQMDIGEDVVSPYLWTRGISRIDAIVLTHAHADHMGGFPAIIGNFRPRELWLPEGIPEQEIQNLRRTAAAYGTNVVYRRAGNSFAYGGAGFRVLAPNPDFPVRSGHRNDESLVMKISYGQTSALLEADAERGTERMLESEEPAADVLKVAHHGSASATNSGFLQVVRPRFAVISVGVRNVYRHPRPEVLERLRRAHVVTYRTDTNGATTFYLDGRSVTPQLPDLR